ncbi:MAG: hypothetical protein R2883_04175 [Caldisericia bacterium]
MSWTWMLLNRPKESSDFVFGVWNEDTESITDYFEREHKSTIDYHSWIYSPGGSIEENTILMASVIRR